MLHGPQAVRAALRFNVIYRRFPEVSKQWSLCLQTAFTDKVCFSISFPYPPLLIIYLPGFHAVKLFQRNLKPAPAQCERLRLVRTPDTKTTYDQF